MAGKCVTPSAYCAGHAGGLLTSQSITEGSQHCGARYTFVFRRAFTRVALGKWPITPKTINWSVLVSIGVKTNNSILIDARDRSNQYDEVQKRHVCNTVGMQH
jgi:hypothetical protein